jgi:biotin operon repressor
MVEIRDRHTGAVLGRWHKDTLAGVYLGHRVPWNLRSVDFRGRDLSGADLTGRDLSDADLTGATLTDAVYDPWTRWPQGFDPQRHGARLVPPDLKGCKLRRAELAGADLVAADLRGGDLEEADLRGAKLNHALLRGANLAGADLTDADLTGADLSGVKHDARTRWPEGFDLAAYRSAQAAAQAQTPEQALDQLVGLLKVLADRSRLRVLGLLARAEATVEELADTLELTEPTVSHHLAKLREQGLVMMRAEGTQHHYRAAQEALASRFAESLSPPRLLEIGRAGLDTGTFERKVLAAFFDSAGRLRQIPVRYKKQRVILSRLIGSFDRGVRYPEAQVNEILKQFHPDCATLRRQMVDFGFMARQNNIYWRLERAGERVAGE